MLIFENVQNEVNAHYIRLLLILSILLMTVASQSFINNKTLCVGLESGITLHFLK